MYILYSLIALVIFGGMFYFDHTLFKSVSKKNIYLVKSILLLLFALIFVAAKNSYEYFFDFVGIEWLYLLIIIILGSIMMILYHKNIESLKPHKAMLLTASSIFFFYNISFLIFSKNTIIPKNNIMNIVLVILELLLVGLLYVLIYFKDRDIKKRNILYSIFSGLCFSLITLLRNIKIKNKLLIRSPLEILFIYVSISLLIISIIYFVINSNKNKNNKKEKVRWQDYILVLMSGAFLIVTFLFTYGAINNFTDSNIKVVKYILSIGVIIPFLINLYIENKHEISFKITLKKNINYLVYILTFIASTTLTLF